MAPPDREARLELRAPVAVKPPANRFAKIQGVDNMLVRLQTSLDQVEGRQMAALNSVEDGIELRVRRTAWRHHRSRPRHGATVSREALERAGRGVYGRRLLENLSTAQIAAYFDRDGDNYKVKPVLRDMVKFAPMNLAQPVCSRDASTASSA